MASGEWQRFNGLVALFKRLWEEMWSCEGFRYTCEKAEATQLLSTYMYIHIYIYACICVHKCIYLIERCFLQTHIKKSLQTTEYRGKKKRKNIFKTNLEGKKSDHVLLWKYSKVLQKAMQTDLQGLTKNLLQVLEMEKKHSVPLKAFWAISNIYLPVPRQRLAFRLIRNAHKRADLNKHVRAHLILWWMEIKKKILLKVEGRKNCL